MHLSGHDGTASTLPALEHRTLAHLASTARLNGGVSTHGLAIAAVFGEDTPSGPDPALSGTAQFCRAQPSLPATAAPVLMVAVHPDAPRLCLAVACPAAGCPAAAVREAFSAALLVADVVVVGEGGAWWECPRAAAGALARLEAGVWRAHRLRSLAVHPDEYLTLPAVPASRVVRVAVSPGRATAVPALLTLHNPETCAAAADVTTRLEEAAAPGGTLSRTAALWTARMAIVGTTTTAAAVSSQLFSAPCVAVDTLMQRQVRHAKRRCLAHFHDFGLPAAQSCFRQALFGLPALFQEPLREWTTELGLLSALLEEVARSPGDGVRQSAAPAGVPQTVVESPGRTASASNSAGVVSVAAADSVGDLFSRLLTGLLGGVAFVVLPLVLTFGRDV